MGNLPRKIFKMKKSSLVVAVTLVILTVGFSIEAATQTHAQGSSTQRTEITGKIRDIHGRPVAALKISLMNWFGADFGSAVTDDQGAFDIHNVAPGSYYVKFRPLAENSPGQVVIIRVPAHAMRMNLTVTRNPPAMARAQSLVAATG